MTKSQDVKNRLELVTEIRKSMTMSPMSDGVTWQGACPFCKTGDFRAKTNIQYFHCMDCTQSGDVIAFVQQVRGVDFRDAVAYLKEIADNK